MYLNKSISTFSDCYSYCKVRALLSMFVYVCVVVVCLCVCVQLLVSLKVFPATTM